MYDAVLDLCHLRGVCRLLDSSRLEQEGKDVAVHEERLRALDDAVEGEVAVQQKGIHVLPCQRQVDQHHPSPAGRGPPY
jgi:hypothetical protein